MRLSLFEDHQVDALRPLTATRAAFELRLGARTLGDWIASRLEGEGSVSDVLVRTQIEEVVRERHPNRAVNRTSGREDGLFVNARFVPIEPAVGQIRETLPDRRGEGRIWTHENQVVAVFVPETTLFSGTRVGLQEGDLGDHERLLAETTGFERIRLEEAVLIEHLSDLVRVLPEALAADAASLASAERPDFREESAGVHAAPTATVRSDAVLDASRGPIVIDEGAIVEWKSVLRGPVYVGTGSLVRTGTKLECTAVGPVCKVAGEITHSVLHGYSNKAHGGFLGHSYIGSWCNLGAQTTTSNLRNDYGPVGLYDPVTEEERETGETFLGCFMGDHSKTAVHTRFNTGTVVGVFCNVFGSGFQPRRIPSFSWGGSEGRELYRFDRAEEVARRVMARRDRTLSVAERDLLRRIYERSARENYPVHERRNGQMPAAS